MGTWELSVLSSTTATCNCMDVDLRFLSSTTGRAPTAGCCIHALPLVLRFRKRVICRCMRLHLLFVHRKMATTKKRKFYRKPTQFVGKWSGLTTTKNISPCENWLLVRTQMDLCTCLFLVGSDFDFPGSRHVACGDRRCFFSGRTTTV